MIGDAEKYRYLIKWINARSVEVRNNTVRAKPESAIHSYHLGKWDLLDVLRDFIKELEK